MIPVIRTRRIALLRLGCLGLVILASLPPAVIAQQATVSLPISSRTGWQSTSLSFSQGEQFSVAWLSGTWTVDARSIPYVGPAGYDPTSDGSIFQGCKFGPYPYGRLLGRVGGGPTFSVGTGGSFTANGSGLLSLRIHDADACLVDNDGSVQVQVSTQAPPTTTTTTTTTRPPAPPSGCDLAIRKSMAPATVAQGQDVIIVLSALNVGSGPCPGPVASGAGAGPTTSVFDDPPDGLQISTPSPPPGWSCSVVDNALDCVTSATINAGSGVTFTFRGRVTAPPGTTLENCADLLSVGDTNQDNNGDYCVTVLVVQQTTTSSSTTSTTAPPDNRTTTTPPTTTTTTRPGGPTTTTSTTTTTTLPTSAGPITLPPTAVPGGPPPITPLPPTLRLSQPSIEPGGRVSASGNGCDPGGAVQLAIDGRPVTEGRARPDGAFELPVDVPNLAVGRYQVVATCGRLLTSPIDVVLVSQVAAPLSTLAVMIFFVLLSVVLFRRRRIVRPCHPRGPPQ